MKVIDNIRSKFLHAREGGRVTHTLDYLVAVFDVLVEVLHTRVENIRKTVFSQVL